METATLTSPPRPVMVLPVQKSMSLPSYARASGEGIDHKLIFAALEQREKIRQKNKIFKDREKKGTSRQSYFCLPLSSTSKCKETSLSSDTSCSSLEFQKPKYRNSPTKVRREEEKPVQNGVSASAIAPQPQSNGSSELHAKEELQVESPPPPGENELYGRIRGNQRAASAVTSEPARKNSATHSPRSTIPRNESSYKNTLGSSDSMERTDKSSRSSNDSLSRKERLVAIKARVEAERLKKLANTSSDEEETETTSLKITRHNSDGMIIRTVREVKTKSSRPERRYRRKNQEELLARRAARRQHTSLYLPSTTDLESWKPPVTRSGSSLSLHGNGDDVDKEFSVADSKPSFLYSGSFPHAAPKDNYYSDICSGSYRSRLVKPIVDDIERKERSNAPKSGKIGFQKVENLKLSGDTSSLHEGENKNSLKASGSANGSKISLDSFDTSLDRIRKCVSPGTRAPTPPPRSPKSIEFVNKAIIQHQNAASNFQTESYSLERKRIAYQARNVRLEHTEHRSADSIIKDLMSSRRKTCSNITMIEDQVYERSKTPTLGQQAKVSSHNFPPRSPDLIQKTSSASRKSKTLVPSPEMNVRKLLSSSETQAKKWERIELDSEKKFNSLENTKMDSWSKFKCLPRKKRTTCFCGEKVCNCGVVDRVDEPSSPRLSLHVSGLGTTSHITDLELDRLLKSATSATSEILLKSETGEKSSSLKSFKEKPRLVVESKDAEFPENEFFSKENASENLNTAMQELEDVYRSLRISSENLSEQHISDDMFSGGKNKSEQTQKLKTENSLRIPPDSSANVPSRTRIESPIRFIDEDLDTRNKSKKKQPETGDSLATETKENATRDALCIEELFSDLTQQLDLEQKLLAESRMKKLTSSPVQKRAAISESQCSIVPDVSTSTSNDPEINYVPIARSAMPESIVDKPTISEIEQRLLARKKHKAVRSLSANIANLMGSPRKSPELCNRTEAQSIPSVEADNENKSSSSMGKDSVNKKLDELTSRLLAKKKSRDENGNSNKSATSLTAPKSSDTTNSGRTNPEEIWQIRVSMDPGDSPAPKSARPTKDNRSSPNLRLQTVLHGPGSSSSTNVGADLGNKDERVAAAPTLSVIGKARKTPSPVPLNENELEKLLSTLLTDVTNGTLPGISPTSPTAAKVSTCSDSYTKANGRHVTNSSMASDVGSKVRADEGNNGAGEGDDLLCEATSNSVDQKLDNDSQRNNNESRTIIGSSFIPVRNSSLTQSRLVQRFRAPPDDNRTTATALQHNSAFAEKVSYSHLYSPPSQNYPRRHSVCIEGLSQGSAVHGQKNHNQDSRFGAVRYRAASPSSLCATAISSAAAPLDVSNGLPGFETRNGNENDKYLRSNSCNGSQRHDNPLSVPPSQRLKDKSFVRKSTLNRLEFVQPAQHTMGYMANSSSPNDHPLDQHSTSEANSDGLNGKSATGIGTSLAVKRKSASFHPSGKDFPNHLQDNSGGRVMSFGLRTQIESLKYRNRRGAKGCMPCFEKKSFSAGEHDIQTDTNDCSRKAKVCFSAQETYPHESKQNVVVHRQPMPLESTKNCVPSSDYAQNSPEKSPACEDVLSKLANGQSCCCPEVAPNSCDNSSHSVLKSEMAEVASTSENPAVNDDQPGENKESSVVQGEPEFPADGSNVATEKSCTALDKDLFTSRCSPVPLLHPHPFPVNDDDICSSSAVSAEVAVDECLNTCSQCDKDMVDVVEGVSCLDLTPTESSALKSSMYDSDKESSKQQQISSILRKKSCDDRREIHGILKNTLEDKVSVKQPASILKHRESSEEKDAWPQSDLHSILKKSSEDESSSSNSPDIRPILKNTSTDDESSGSKPKPILKKRTSFNEDCSYACFHGNDLKPILKKKTINDLCEEQPKPILKTRRKSEEAASILSEFPVGGARPRAYSADRGIRISSEKKLNDDDFT